MAGKKTIDIERFIDEYTSVMANIDNNIEEFMRVTALNFQKLAEFCFEAKDKDQLGQALKAYFDSYSKGSLNLVQGIRAQITTGIEMLGGLLSNIEEISPGIFSVRDESDKIGVRCVVRDEDGNLREIPLEEVAARLSEEELARMEAQIGPEAMRIFRDAKKKKEE